MERNWKKELREILEKNNMSEEYIEETLEYSDDERGEPIVRTTIKTKNTEEVKKDLDIPSC